MKKIISFILAVSIIFSLAQPALAAGLEDSLLPPDTVIEGIDGGHIFFQDLDDKTVCIITNETDGFISIAIGYDDEANTVYQWAIDNYLISDFAPNDIAFWTGLINYAEENMDDSFCTVFERTPSDGTVVLSAPGRHDLWKELVALHGYEYSDHKEFSEHIGGAIFTVYESLTYDIFERETLSWNSATTITGLLVTLLGPSLSATASMTASLLMSLLGVVSPDTPIGSGDLICYNCSAFYTRYVTTPSSNRHWSTTYKDIQYLGYENASSTAIEPAVLSTDEVTTSVVYSHSKSFYESGLVDDAYRSVYG